MHRIQFIHLPPDDPAVRRRAIIASFAFHGLALTALLLLTIYYELNLPPPPNGSAAGAPTMTLEPMVVVSSPPEPPPPSEATPPPVPMPPVMTTVPNPVTPMKVPDLGVPALPPAPSRTSIAKIEAPHHASPSHPTTPSNAKPAASSVASSYAPGASSFRHPPYPEEARSRGESGTVTVLVEFNAQGDVARAEITESSGVPVLDSTTRSFIRQNWHSSEYAGQSINVPVQYLLENH